MALSEVVERQQRALALHLQGATFEQIAQLLGYASRGSAHNAVQAALKNRVPTASRVEAYRVEAARCDMVLTALAPQVKAGDPKSVALFLTASERRTQLAGLLDDAPSASKPAQEVRTPLDELHARRAARGGNRGTARGARAAAAGVPEVHED